MTDMPLVSVIIPTFDSNTGLLTCIEALSKQTYPGECLEVIVVNNHPTINSPRELANFKFVRALHHPEHGSYAARNKGIAAANGDILAFTDADCVPTENWIANAIKILSQTDIDYVGGRVKLFYQRSGEPNVFEAVDEVIHFQQRINIEQKKFSVTANLMVSKPLIDKVGVFGETLMTGGDKEFGQRVFKSGFQQIYGHEVIVGHPARCNFQQIYNKISRIRGGSGALRKAGVGNGKSSSRPSVRRFIRTLFYGYAQVQQNYGNLSALFRLKVIFLILFFQVVESAIKYKSTFKSKFLERSS